MNDRDNSGGHNNNNKKTMRNSHEMQLHTDTEDERRNKFDKEKEEENIENFKCSYSFG